MRVFLTTTSYQDTPGPHHAQLAASGFDVVRDRGPLTEAQMLAHLDRSGGFDGLLNGDDQITAKVIDHALAMPTPLKVISKYGIGLDSIDVQHALDRGVAVLNTPGVNHTTVAEHAIGLMVAASKHFAFHLAATKQGKWHRKTGIELMGKTLAVVGMGRIGQAVCERAKAFGMHVTGWGRSWDEGFAERVGVERVLDLDVCLQQADVVSLHLPATPQTTGLINAERLATMKDGVVIVNTGRGALVVDDAIVAACQSGKVHAYATDVMDPEPMAHPHVFEAVDNILITPHVGSRTLESVQRQAARATTNLVEFLNGGTDVVHAAVK